MQWLSRVLFARGRPVEAQAAAWLESSLLRLHHCFVWPQWAKRVPVVPSDEFYPVRASADRPAAQEIFKLTCGYMNVSPAEVRFRVMQAEQEAPDLGQILDRSGGVAFLEGDRKRGRTVAIKPQLLPEPLSLVAAISHELAHLLLHDCRTLKPQERHDEKLTDLMTVYAGMGVFTANAAFGFESRPGGWRVQRSGYLSEPEFGYALAVFAAMRGEVNPSWASYLDPNVREFYESSIRSINKERRTELAAEGTRN